MLYQNKLGQQCPNNTLRPVEGNDQMKECWPCKTAGLQKQKLAEKIAKHYAMK